VDTIPKELPLKQPKVISYVFLHQYDKDRITASIAIELAIEDLPVRMFPFKYWNRMEVKTMNKTIKVHRIIIVLALVCEVAAGHFAHYAFSSDPRFDEADMAIQKAIALLEAAQFLPNKTNARSTATEHFCY
jgi:hypothetical protein